MENSPFMLNPQRYTIGLELLGFAGMKTLQWIAGSTVAGFSPFSQFWGLFFCD